MNSYAQPDFTSDFGDTAYWSAGLLKMEILDAAAANVKATLGEDNVVDIEVKIRVADGTRLDEETAGVLVESALHWAHNKRKANQ